MVSRESKFSRRRASKSIAGDTVADDLIRSDVRVYLRMQRPRMEVDCNEYHIIFSEDGLMILKVCKSGEAIPHAG